MTLYAICREPAAKPFNSISDAMRLCQIGMSALHQPLNPLELLIHTIFRRVALIDLSIMT